MQMINLRKIKAGSKLFRKAEGGQASIEFALTIVFAMLLIVGVLELIMLIYTYTVLADSAKEGVRYAIVHGSDVSTSAGPTCPCPAIDGPAGTGVVKNFARASLHDTSAPAMIVTVDYNPGGINTVNCNDPLCVVRVTVSYSYQPFFGMGWPTIPVNAAAEGRIAY